MITYEKKMDFGKISHSGLLARSPEGHAARGMAIKGNEDVWVEIQANTFRNWVNEHLPHSLRVGDLSQDLCTGVRLCALVESLQGRPLVPSWNKRPANHHHYLENVMVALNAIEQDGVKLVNIGNVDIVNGNLKLILGLIWSLIVRYQIGRSKFPPRKLMLAWLQAVLPKCRVQNLTTNWNSGLLLSALVNYCSPGTFPHWEHLDKSDGINNCRVAMEIAQRDLGIPAVLEPEYLSSPWLDELSGMTYLSYFMKPDSPGFRSTLHWVNSRLTRPVQNFTRDWNDGRAITEVVRSLGGPVTHPEKLKTDPIYWESNLNQALEGGKRLGVQPVLSAKDMADTNVEHLGVMAYVAQFQWLPEKPQLQDLIEVTLSSTSGRVGEVTNYEVILHDPSLSYYSVSVEIRAPDNKVYQGKTLKQGRGTFVPMKMGMHEIVIHYDGEEVKSGHYFRVLPQLSVVAPPGISPCALGSLVQVLVSATGAPKREDILVTAYSPSGRPLDCPLTHLDQANSATFKPDETGQWTIEITYQGKQIQGGPFTCFVFNPDGVKVFGLDGALPLIPHHINVDCRGVGVPGDITADIVHDKKSVHCRMEKVDSKGFLHKVHFTPMDAGKHRVYVYLNGYDVRGSPFMMRVGTQKRNKLQNKNNNVKHQSSFTSLYTDSSPSAFYNETEIFRSDESANKHFERSTVTSPTFNRNISSPNYYRNTSPQESTSSTNYAKIKTKNDNFMSDYDYTTSNMSSMRVNETSPNTKHKPSERNFKKYESSQQIHSSSAGQSRPPQKSSRKTSESSKKTTTENSSFNKMQKERKEEYHRIFNESSKHHYYTTSSPYFGDSGNEGDSTVFSPQQSPYSTGARSVLVQPQSSGVLGQPVEFEIDGSRAGSGDLEILVDGGNVTSSVKSLGGQRFRAAFTPHQAVPHRVDVKFNGETVPGSPWHVNIERMSPANVTVLGESTRLVPANNPAIFEIITGTNLGADDLLVHVVSPSKRTVPVRVVPASRTGVQCIEFVPKDVGIHVIEVSTNGDKIPGGPIIAKVYDTSLIQVTDVGAGVVNQTIQFKVDASQAGEGQLEISINEGEVPNHVQVVGGGRCLVSFTPETAKSHLVDIKFNGEPVRGCPFVFSISDTSRVSVNLSHLELVAVNQASSFHMEVAGGGEDAELAVAIRGPHGTELPVKVTGDVHSGFSAEFTPQNVGVHQISVDYNGRPIHGTPFLAKAFDVDKVTVGTVARGAVGRPVTFTVDASEAGEGNLEITISARGVNIPTQVHPQGNAKFAVSFVPAEACDHVVNVSFNKRPVVGCPLIVNVGGGNAGPTVTLPGPGPIHRPSTLLINHSGKLEDVEVNVEGPGGQAVPTQVQALGDGQFRAEFTPRVVGEHRINVSISGVPTAGSPYAAKVYDVQAIKVKECLIGVVGKPVTFLVETSQAGPGNLEVTVNGGRVPTSAQAQGPHTYAISFTPRDVALHSVELRFNGQDVPGSPFKCSVSPAARILNMDTTLDKVSVGKACTFGVESPSPPLVEILGPARRSLPTQVTPQKNSSPGKFDVTFTPEDVGDHSVEVRLPGGHVEGSPFLIKAYDANKVTVTDINDGVVGKAVSFSINASQAGAGNLEIIVAVAGRNVPNFVQSEGNARFKVNFKPTEAATHTLSVRFNGHPVPGSPFSCKVVAGNTQPKIPVSGNGIELAAVGHTAEIKIEGVTGSEPQVDVTSPVGKTLPVKLMSNSDGHIIHFVPEAVGRHSVAILVHDQHVIGSPFSCNVYDVNKVIVTGLPDRRLDLSQLSLHDSKQAEVGKPITFNVDAAQAGEGTLELVVSTQYTTIKADVVACARGLYDVTFVPQTAEEHYVNITFNDMSVVGSPFKCSVGESTQYVQIGSPFYMDLPSEHHRLEILDRHNHHIKYTSNNGKAEFSLPLVGTYTVQIYKNNEIIGTRNIHVFDTSKIDVTTVAETVCHRPAVIGVNVSQAGPGKLSASVKMGGKDVAHSVRQSSSNSQLWEVVFHPIFVAPHKITLFYNNVPKFGTLDVVVKGIGTEPFVSGVGLHQSNVGKVTSFQIDTNARPAREFDVVISGPSGSAVPVRCYQTKTGKLQAEFTTREVGGHKIEVLHLSKPVNGSPFSCQAFEADLVRIMDVPHIQGNVGERVMFNVSTKNCGVADLEIQATNPINQLVAVVVNEVHDDLQQVSFLPSMAGLYQVCVTFGGVAVKSSPLALGVGPMGPTPPPRAVGKGLESGQVGERTSFTVTGTVQPRIQIDAPEGNIDVYVQSPKPGEYIASYTPKWVGTYDIVISIGTTVLPGSPFRPTIVDPSVVRLIGGWDQFLDNMGRLKLPVKLSFDTTNAGPGTLECYIDGRRFRGEKSGNRIRFELGSDGLNAGEHNFEMKFSSIPIADTPKYTVSATDQVILTGRGLAQAHCGETASFTIDGSKAGIGNPEVTLQASDSNLPIPVMMSLNGEKLWKVTYTVNAPGNYLLTVLWAGRPVKGCPLVVEVKGGADASKVLCSGEGLRQGVVGREIRSWIDTRRAGPGELTAHCTGPRKVAYCELYDHGDATFTLNVKPQEAGKHALTIKYANQHVPGSPFTLKVAGAPDASKVKVYGPGIEHGVLATFQSRFICDTRGAGAGQLTVRVRGPKGAFRVEMQRESQKDRTILCKYDPTEPGDYRVEVKWAGELVPGSPFHVMIFDTHEELRRYINSL